MGIVSRELSSGSIKLLYSSPVTNSQIILGKFVSTVIYALVMCCILLLYVFVAGGTIQNFEWGAVLIGLLGLFLLTCTYAAVGIFISSLTTYQFVAAVGTFLSLMFLTYVGTWWQEYDFIRDITYWLSINGRASTFINGMICSEDLLYFPLVMVLFLSLTIIRLNAIRQKIPFLKTLGKNIIIIIAVCFIGYLSSRPVLMTYYDGTSIKWNTLTKQSRDILSKLDGDLTITGYCNVLSGSYSWVGYPYFIQKNRELFKQYERFKPEIKLRMVYYYDSLVMADGEKVAEYFAKECAKEPNQTLWERAKFKSERTTLDSTILKTPEEIHRKLDLTGERTFVWHIKRENGDSSGLRIYNDMIVYPVDSEISTALKRLTMDLPKVAFINVYKSRTASDYTPWGYSMVAGEKSYRESLLNQGFDVVEVDLNKEIPSDVDILVLSDWREIFTSEEEMVLRNYIASGRNLFILGEPKRREIMNPFLRKLFGVELMEGTLVQYRQPEMAPDVLVAVVDSCAVNLSYQYGRIPYVVLPNAAGIEQVKDCGFEMIPILKTDTVATDVQKKENIPYYVWNEMEGLDYMDEKLIYNPSADEVAKEYYPAVALRRMVNGREQRVIVTGDADCISNGELAQRRSAVNLYMILGSFHYLSDNEMPVDVRRPAFRDTEVFIDRAGYDILHAGFLYVLPLLLFGICMFLWIRRRGR